MVTRKTRQRVVAQSQPSSSCAAVASGCPLTTTGRDNDELRPQMRAQQNAGIFPSRDVPLGPWSLTCAHAANDGEAMQSGDEPMAGNCVDAALDRGSVATNGSFLDAKLAAPRHGRPTASGAVERQQWVEI